MPIYFAPEREPSILKDVAVETADLHDSKGAKVVVVTIRAYDHKIALMPNEVAWLVSQLQRTGHAVNKVNKQQEPRCPSIAPPTTTT